MRTDQTPATPIHADASWKIGIVHSTYYKEEIDQLVAGAKDVLREAGLPDANVSLHPVPGSFEIPLIGRELAEQGKLDALMAFGIIVQGETKHADLLGTEVARGIMEIQLRYGIPFAFEVLHVLSFEQAKARAGGPQGKGREAAYAVLHSLAELNRIRSGAY